MGEGNVKKSFNCISFKSKKLFVICLITIVLLLCAIMNYYEHSSVKSVVKHRLQWWLTSIEWDEERTKLSGKGITIAVLDTGIDFKHNDLKSCKYEEISVVEQFNENEINHGTAIAGIISAYPHDEKGVLGIAPNSKILSIDVTNSETVDIDNLIKGINIAIDKNVDIINISIGIKEGNDELHACIKEAYDKGIVIVASAGNYMKDEVLYPAVYDEVIAVGACDRKGRIISPKGDSLDVIFMPGDNIVSCISENNYAGVQGTSFSTAIVSGIVAIVKEEYPNIDNKEIYAAIKRSISTHGENRITVNRILDEVKE